MKRKRSMAGIMRTLMSRTMPTCAEVTRLVSIGLDENLTLRDRFRVRFHLAFCKFCSRFEVQVRMLRELAREIAARAADVSAESAVRLNPDAKAKFQDAIRHELR